MRSLSVPEVWQYVCDDDRVQASVIYPAGYRGQQAITCPRCGQYMLVKHRPKEKNKSNVINMWPRRQAQLYAEALSSPPNDDGAA